MGSPFLIVQLSDPHIGADWADGDPVAALAAAVDCLRAMRPQPDAVLVTGDLADRGSDGDAIGLADRSRRSLGEVLDGHRQVRGIVAGHMHRTIVGHLAGAPGADGPEHVCPRAAGL